MSVLTDEQIAGIVKIFEPYLNIDEHRAYMMLSGWDICQPNFNVSSVFSPDWENAPDDAEWWAMDNNGLSFWYSSEPRPNFEHGEHAYSPFGGNSCNDGFMLGTAKYVVPKWASVKIQRPDETRKPKGHVHAELIMKYAEVAARRPDPWEEFECKNARDSYWTALVKTPNFKPELEYRWVGEK